jgi:TatD DNase family protein
LVNAGAYTNYNQNGIHIAQQAKKLFPELTVKATVGFHPIDADALAKSDFSALMKALEQQYLTHTAEVIAIGECGIDLHRKEKNLDHQQTLFKLHAELARKWKLPLIIHSRDAFEETLEVLEEFTELKLYFHCRGYGAAEVKRVEKLFPQVWLGFTNILSYPSAITTRESLLAVESARILMETDAPFLPPQAFRGKMNYPAYVKNVYTKSAEILGMQEEVLETLVEEHFFALFPTIS